jgi:hypothetical protein
MQLLVQPHGAVLGKPEHCLVPAEPPLPEAPWYSEPIDAHIGEIILGAVVAAF